MSLLCKTGCRSNGKCSCGNTAVQGATTTAVASETTGEVTVRAMLNTVLDSCCTTEDVCREITVNCPGIFNPCELEVGSILTVELDDDITFREVQRSKDACTCVSSVKFNIPVRIYGTENCCCDRYIARNITVLRSVKLCCTADSELMTNNSKVIALSAVVTDICGDEVTLSLCMLFRSCVQQVIQREYTWQATPVCIFENCNDARNQLIDSCDTTCGCVAGNSCPSC